MKHPTYQAVQTSEGLRMVCGWFATCDQPTEQATEHPILGPVPICPRCAGRMDITDLMDIEVK